MKNIILIILFLLSFSVLNAQKEPMRFFAGPTFELGLSPQTNVSLGGILGFAEKNYFLGVFGTNTFYEDVLIKDIEYQKTLDLGGLIIGFTFPSEERAHLFGSLKLGWGEACLRNYYDTNRRSYMNSVFAINPEIGMEVKVSPWYSFAITASYRLVEGVDDLSYLRNYDFENYGVGITFRFGDFH